MSSKVDRSKYYRSEYYQVAILVAMATVAQRMGINKGVAFVMVKSKRDALGNPRYIVVNEVLVREPVGREVEMVDPGTNYFGAAMGKLAYMLAKGVDSGTKDQTHKGEMPYRGGLVKEVDDDQIYIGFSGGTENQDVEIAEFGMKMLLSAE